MTEAERHRERIRQDAERLMRAMLPNEDVDPCDLDDPLLRQVYDLLEEWIADGEPHPSEHAG